MAENEVYPGDVFVMTTPSGGGFGKPEGQMGRVSEALQEFYGLGPTDTRVLDRFAAGLSDEFTEAVTEIVQDGLDQGVPAADLARASRLVQGYEKEFWDTLEAIDQDARSWPPRGYADRFHEASHAA